MNHFLMTRAAAGLLGLTVAVTGAFAGGHGGHGGGKHGGGKDLWLVPETNDEGYHGYEADDLQTFELTIR